MGDVHSNAGFRKLEQEPLAKAGLREARRRGIPGGTLAKGSLRLAGGTEASKIMLGWRADCGPQGSHMMGTSAKAREATGSIPTCPVAMRTAHPAGPVARPGSIRRAGRQPLPLVVAQLRLLRCLAAHFRRLNRVKAYRLCRVTLAINKTVGPEMCVANITEAGRGSHSIIFQHGSENGGEIVPELETLGLRQT